MRKRNQRRRQRIAALMLTFVLLGTAYLFVFFGRRAPLADTPYTLVVQPGVSDDSLALVRTGLAHADQYLLATIGETVTEPTDVRVSSFTPCSPFAPIPAFGSTAEVVGNRMCVNTQNGVWHQALAGSPGIARAVMAHEHFHLFQQQLGCLPSPWHKDYQWLVEGSAAYVGWETAIASGDVDRAWVNTLLTTARSSAMLQPLAAYERTIDGDAAYSLADQAVQRLVQKTGSLQSFVAFCRQVGQGVAWREAFTQQFGTSVDVFYEEFEAARASER